MAGTEIVYLDGAYMPRTEARISPDDRGFTFGDGVYEVTPIYRGYPLAMEERLARLRNGLSQLRIDWDVSQVATIYRELLDRNDLGDAAMTVVYLQVTRGAAPRTHNFPPEGTKPTVYANARAYERPSRAEWDKGASAITFPDFRWGRADIKSLQLLPNVLAQEAARRAGADEAILLRDGIALEGARSNLFLLRDGVLWTHPTSNQILTGISRGVVLELAAEKGYEVREGPTPADEVARATEIFLTGSVTEVRPLVRIDGRPVGTGAVGPVTHALYDAFLERIRAGMESQRPKGVPA
jgi:D-alanine transaminase